MDFIRISFFIVTHPHPPLLKTIHSNPKKPNIMKPRSNPLLRASRLALLAITFGSLPVFAGTTWDGGGADTNLGTGANWNVDDLAPAFDGTQNVTFSTAGTTATVAPAGNIDFNSITLNQTSGFTIQSGAGTLRVKGTTTSSTTNGCINASGSNGMTISAPVVVSTVGTIFNVNNSNSAATGLTLSGGLSASSGTYSFRLGGSGKTVISGTVTGVNAIQQSTASAFTGTVVFDCNLAAAGGLNIPSTGSGTVTAAKIQMGTSTSQTQSWTSSAITQNSTIIVNSTATMTTLAIGAAASAGSSGATVEVGGNLSGTTLTVGGAVYTGNLKVSGTASFSGALATGALAGSKIVGNDVTNGTLKLSSGSNLNGSTSTVIGGAGNENNLNLEKISSGTLTLTGINPYTGSTTVTAGILEIGGATLSGTTALSVGASGTLGLTVSTPSTIPGTATFTSGSKVKLTGTATDGAVIMTATAGMSGTAPTLDPVVPGFITEISGTQLKLKAAVVPAPLNTWDAGAAPDTNINTAANWGQDTLPATTATASFGDAGSTATVNVDTQFAGVVLNRNAAFTVAGPNNLILSSVNSSTSTNLVLASTAGGTQTINAPLQVDTTNTANKFLSLTNNSTTQTLDINGAISLSSGSTADYAMRFQNAAGSVTRIDGALNNISGVQQGFSGTVAGDLVFGGNRTSTAAVTVASTSTGVAPATTARMFLGETPADTQAWGNLTLNNTIKLVVGGNVTAGTISVGGNASAANTRVVGNSATNSTLSLTGGTISNLATLGGAGSNENNLSLVMAGPNTLTISGGTHTYTGPTTVNGGTLSVASGVALPSSITVNAGSTLAGEGSTTGTLAFGAGNTSISFDPGTSGSFTANSVNLTGAGIVYVTPTAAMTNGTPYVVLSRSTGSFSGGDLAKFALTTRGGALSITGGSSNEITLTAAASTPASLVWKGNAANPTFWDAAITQNWTNGGSPDRFYTDDNVTFDNTASSFVVNVQGTSVMPGNMVFSNNLPNNYTVGGGTIGGTGSLTKSGTGTVTLTQAGTNTFSGALAINAGTLSISNLNQIGGGSITRAIELGGGTLQYTYNATTAQTSNTVPLTLNSGTSTFEITGSVVTGDINGTVLPVTLRLGAAVTGGGDLIKSGGGILALGLNSVTPQNSTFTGTVQVTGGALDIRNPDSLGDVAAGTTISNASLEIFPFGQNAGVSFDAEPLTLSGSSYVRMKNEDTDSDIVNTWTGTVTVSAGAVVGISAPKQATLSSSIANTITSISPNISKLDITGSVSTGAGSVLKLGLIPVSATVPAVQSGVAQTIDISGALTGSGSVETQGASTSVYTLSLPSYSGNTTVNGGTLQLGAVNANNESSTVTVATGAKIDIAFAGNDTVAALVLGGTNMGPGTYNATTQPTFFAATSTGSIVVPAPVAGYSAWQSTNGAGVQTVDQDHDNDGVKNGIEYFLGGTANTTGFTALPGPVAGAVTWPKAATYTGTFGTGFKVQSSTDLINWTDAAAGAGAGQVNIVGNNVTYTLPTGAGKTFVRLLVNPN